MMYPKSVLLRGSLLLLICLAVSLYGQLLETQVPQNALDIIRLRGFLGELYTIQSNGYPLTLYRIINPLANPDTLNKYPVLYGHGILFDAASMINPSENARPRKPELGRATIKYSDLVDKTDDYSLPFMFSNNNFDVWLFDARGTNELNRNITANPFQANKFWDYSLDEQALIDLPLMIDFVLTKTASTKLVYVGYSQTTLFMFALMATAPEYQSKVVAFVGLAPVAYVSHIKGLTLPLLGPMAGLTPEFIHDSFVPLALLETVNSAIRSPCHFKGLSELICGALVNGVGGNGVGKNSPNFFVDFYKSTSLKAVKHLFQLFTGRRFGMYDYGPIENVKRYSQPHPPAYDLSKIKSDRLVLARGGADFLSTPEDSIRLISELGNKPYLDLPIENYNHFDFIDGKDLIKLVNGPLMLAVYELMYKSGPDILRSAIQKPVIADATNISSNVTASATASANSNAASATSRLLMNRNYVAESNSLVKNSADLIQTLAGAKGLLESIMGR